MMRGVILTLALLAATLPAAAQEAPFRLEAVAEGLESPVYAISPPDDPRLFIVQQSGQILILADGQVAESPFLDIADSISFGGEQGLLGLAFHPGFGENGRFYVNYTDREGTTQVVEYAVGGDPNAADPASARVLLTQTQPYPNHNGGWIDFGPDGLLYVGMGDGGAGGDPQRHGQNETSLLGKILTLDVDAGGQPSIMALGVRNPWRNAFDGEMLYVADVGQDAWEEISVITLERGQNLGWNLMEGAECFRGACDQAGLVLPVHAYNHDVGCSITGGFVYRGSAIPALDGHYFFGDFCSGRVFSFRYADGAAEEVTDYTDALGSIGNITSFGRDSAGELYITLQDGQLLKLVPAS